MLSKGIKELGLGGYIGIGVGIAAGTYIAHRRKESELKYLAWITGLSVAGIFVGHYGEYLITKKSTKK